MKKITLMFFAMLLVGYTSNAQVCGEVFMDSGGTESGYSSSESSSTTITPENSGDVVTLVFTYVDIEANTYGGGCYDYLTIYDGPDNTYPILAETLCGEVSGDGGDPGDGYRIDLGDTFTSTDASGALTIEFTSDSSVQGTGWEANIICGPPPTCTAPTIDSSIAVEDSCTPEGTGTYNVEIVVSDAGDAGSVFDDGTNTYPVVVGTVIAGPYASGEEVTITLDVLDGEICDSPVGTFEFTCPLPAPANDECSGAIALTINSDLECTSTTSGTIEAATPSGVDETACYGTENDDVWFSFVATESMHQIELLNVVGSYTDLYHSVWSGSCGELTNLTCSDSDTSTVTGLTVGETYLLRINSYGSSNYVTTFDICLSTLPAPVANDECVDAIELTVSDDTCNNVISGTTENAYASIEDTCSAINKDVWYSFTPSETNIFNIDVTETFDSSFSSTYLSVYEGACGALTQVGSSCYSSSFSGELTASTTYYVNVRSSSSSAYVNFDLCVIPAPAPPANNDCSGAQAVTQETEIADVDGATAVSGTIESAVASGVAAEACGSYTGTANDDVWYSFVALTEDVNIDYDLTFDGVAILYTGTCDELTYVACSDNFGLTEEINATGLTVGETYYTRIFQYGTDSTSGLTFDLKIWSPSEDALSLNDFESETAFTYYPNPVKNTLTLNAQNTIEQVAMYNMLGQEVLRTMPNAVASDLDMSNLQTGTYFVKVTIANVTETIRVIKQ
ncbi:T9SS type A sorting domain-containing protein [Winogradskyella vidalii]|uniref:T9SS type A sorting domain-containing protein n=1 Tax=Winogradskyella vidalii TaxID=2615024 RepID=UPI0015C82FE9|nr:T9SS type A sorting domain-containing protein [Winogradskyella vidalii]